MRSQKALAKIHHDTNENRALVLGVEGEVGSKNEGSTAKIQKQPVQNNWHSQIKTQKVEVETLES